MVPLVVRGALGTEGGDGWNMTGMRSSPLCLCSFTAPGVKARRERGSVGLHSETLGGSVTDASDG